MQTEVLIRERKSVKYGKTYEYRFEAASCGGKRQWITKGGFRTKKEAKSAGMMALNEYNNCGKVVVDSDISFSDFMDMWIEQECRNTLKNVTVTGYKKKIKIHINPELGKYELKNIKKADLQNLLNKMHDNGYAKNSIIEVKGILTKCFTYAVNENYISASPAQGLRTPKSEFTKIPTRSAPHSYLTKEKMNMIFERFPYGSPSYIPLLLGYRCGLRIGETFALIWDDIDFEAKTLCVNKQVQWMQNDRSEEDISFNNGRKDDTSGFWYFSTPKYKSFRTVDLDDELAQILKQEKEHQKEAEEYFKERYARYYVDDYKRINTKCIGEPVNFVCVREDGTYINSRTMQHTSSVIQKQLNIPEFTYHSLRHTHSTMLLECGAPIKYIQTRLGHKNIDVTLNVYQHYTKELAEQGKGVLMGMFG